MRVRGALSSRNNFRLWTCQGVLLNRIRDPMQINEATVQAELYKRLRGEGLRVICEPHLDAPEESSRQKGIRPDMMILDSDNSPTVLVEVKNYATRRHRTGPFVDVERCPTKQLRNYVLTGFPVLLCRGWGDLDSVLPKAAILHALQVGKASS